MPQFEYNLFLQDILSILIITFFIFLIVKLYPRKFFNFSIIKFKKNIKNKKNSLKYMLSIFAFYLPKQEIEKEGLGRREKISILSEKKIPINSSVEDTTSSSLELIHLKINNFYNIYKPFSIGLEKSVTYYMENSKHMLIIISVVCIVITCTISVFLLEIFITNIDNHTPLKKKENLWVIETIFLIIPLFIVLILIIPSLASIYMMDYPSTGCNNILEITASQWQWKYIISGDIITS